MTGRSLRVKLGISAVGFAACLAPAAGCSSGGGGPGSEDASSTPDGAQMGDDASNNVDTGAADHTTSSDGPTFDSSNTDGAIHEAASGDSSAAADSGSNDGASGDGAVADGGSDAADGAPNDAAPTDGGSGDGAPKDGGVAGYALQFSPASTDYVDLGPSLSIPANFTIEAWINPTSVTGEVIVFSEEASSVGANQFRFGLTTGHLFFTMTDATGQDEGLYTSSYNLQSAAVVAAGTWTHVAVTKTGADFALYINGAEDGSFVQADAGATLSHGGSNHALIGGRNNGGFASDSGIANDGGIANELFSGTIDEVRFWNMGRSVASVQANYNHTITSSDSQYANLIGYWKFDDGSGNYASDTKVTYLGTLKPGGAGGPTWVVSTAPIQ